MPYLFVRHAIEDAARWREDFDAHAPQRAAAGLEGGYVLHDLDAEGFVTVMLAFERERAEGVRAYAAAFKVALKAAGVNKPLMCLLDDAVEI